MARSGLILAQGRIIDNSGSTPFGPGVLVTLTASEVRKFCQTHTIHHVARDTMLGVTIECPCLSTTFFSFLFLSVADGEFEEVEDLVWLRDGLQRRGAGEGRTESEVHKQ